MKNCSYDFDAPDIQDIQKHKARKSYICEECNENIKPGEDYVAISSLFEGSWSHYSLCEYCDHDWKVLIELGYCAVLGDLRELWEQAFGRNSKEMSTHVS